MTFTGIEFAAITKMVFAIVNADDKVDNKEIRYIATEMARFGITESSTILKMAEEMETSKAVGTIAALDDERKRYVSAYLGTTMIIDGEIDEKELALWRLITSLCSLPQMTVKEAIEYIKGR